MDKIEKLKLQIQETEDKLRELKSQLFEAEQETRIQSDSQPLGWKWPLEAFEYERYGRQLILPNVGVKGQYTASEWNSIF
jgi:adenylyltransferase and sulfurtransferase